MAHTSTSSYMHATHFVLCLAPWLDWTWGTIKATCKNTSRFVKHFEIEMFFRFLGLMPPDAFVPVFVHSAITLFMHLCRLLRTMPLMPF